MQALSFRANVASAFLTSGGRWPGAGDRPTGVLGKVGEGKGSFLFCDPY